MTAPIGVPDLVHTIRHELRIRVFSVRRSCRSRESIVHERSDDHVARAGNCHQVVTLGGEALQPRAGPVGCVLARAPTMVVIATP
jgi:hypothetical protein